MTQPPNAEQPWPPHSMPQQPAAGQQPPAGQLPFGQQSAAQHQPFPAQQAAPPPGPYPAPAKKKPSKLEANFGVTLAVLLGIASIVTAWASFQASIYDGKMAEKNTLAGILAAEAESMYLEANSTYLTDAATFARITELTVQEQYGDSYTADIARETLTVLLFQSVSDDLLNAIDWSNAQNDLDPESYVSPQESDEYLSALFGGYQDTKTAANEAMEAAAVYNDLGDQLTLATVMLAISLFLYGLAAVVKSFDMRLFLAAIATLITVIATAIGVFAIMQPTP
ncbi:hypothetical protein ACQUSY_11565 [Microbacterium sp. YY-03]|uniref:hypothetical protein n=1 Tax=Microbacterium sp. YY-03 TaxID=3421636 RepID=UPI003D1818A3